MSEGTLETSPDKIAISQMVVECTLNLSSNSNRSALRFSDFPRISTLRGLYASIKLMKVEAEVRQNAMLGTEDGDAIPTGHIFIAIIPSARDTDAATGSASHIVQNVPNKQTFALSSTMQNNVVFQFDLSGYELDLAQDPRRGAAPVAWLGNSGVGRMGSAHIALCTATWRITVACSGNTPLWI